MKIQIAVLIVLLSTIPLLAGETNRDELTKTALHHWNFGEAIPQHLKAAGKITPGLAQSGPGAREGAKAARFEHARLDAGTELRFDSAALTIYLRARMPDGRWNSSLFAKRGGHEVVTFNMFGVDLPETPGADIGFEIRTDKRFYMVSFPISRIDPKGWHDLAGRYDGKKIQIVCDGKIMAELPASGIPVRNSEPLLLGAETTNGKIDEGRVFSGEIEEAAIWTRALSDAELAAVMRQPGIKTEPAPAPVAPAAAPRVESFREMREAFLNDPHRPLWHFLCPEEGHAMPFDPNGAIFWKGRYHLFYIFQKRGVHCWGHSSSVDLLHWRHHKTALDVAAGDPDRGIFSGNAFLDRAGVPTIMYHGLSVGNCIAQSHDDLLEKWEKLETNPIVPIPKPGDPNHGKLQSWDPHGWFENGNYYAIFGGSPATLVKGPELMQLSYLHKFVENDKLSVAGDDISCPDFFQLGDRHVLVAISHVRGVRWWSGTWKNDHFVAEQQALMTFPGSSYFAPETLLDGKNRRLLWGWTLDPRGNAAAHGWSGVMSMPRVLKLAPDKTLLIESPEELQKLRLDPRARRDLVLAENKDFAIDDVRGDSLELWFEAQPAPNAEVGVKIRCAPDGSEQTEICYDTKSGQLKIDFSKSSLDTSIHFKSWVINAPGDANERNRRVTVQTAPLNLREGESLRLRIFLDRSMLEVYANGRQCLTQRIFPTHRDSVGVSLFSRGAEARRVNFEAWEMAATNPY